MWIVTKQGFLSVVRNLDSKGPSSALLVRGRVREDLQHLANFAARRGERPAVTNTPDADYVFRLATSRAILSAYLDEEVDGLTYPNFKGEVAKADPKRAHVYMGVWTALRKLQGARP
jgi:hypothetical protein